MFLLLSALAFIVALAVVWSLTDGWMTRAAKRDRDQIARNRSQL